MKLAVNRESGIVNGESAGLRTPRLATVDSPHFCFIGKGSHNFKREYANQRLFRFTIHHSRFTASSP